MTGKIMKRRRLLQKGKQSKWWKTIQLALKVVHCPMATHLRRPSDLKWAKAELQTVSSTTPPPSPSSTPVSTSSLGNTSKSEIGIIVGTTCGATILIFLIVGGVLCYRVRFRPSNSQQPISDAGSRRWHPLTLPDEEKATHHKSGVIPSSQAIASSYTLPLSIVTEEGSQIDVHDDTSVRSYEPSVTMSSSMGTTTTSSQEAGPHFDVVGARTTRQMKNEERIYELRAKMVSLYENSRFQRMAVEHTDLAPLGSERLDREMQDLREVKEKIERLRVVQGGKWARGLSDGMPAELI
ncbi:hypothetical protein L218DRAFT_1004775 [Marasmius fiardii PR-910]|nr:hypothetical protein L218DRAFT_1004775 [Marasmius fiardii PR-910]